MSITNTVFKISADISKYKSDMQAAENVRKNISEKIAGYDRKEAQAQAELSLLTQKRINKQKELDDAMSTGKPESAVRKLRNELARLSQQEDRLHAKIISNNKAKQASYNNLAETLKTKSGMLGSALKGIGIAGLATAATAFFNSSINKLDAIAKRARDLSISASAFQELQHQATLAGVPLEKLEIGLKKLVQTTGKDAKTAMTELAEKAESGTLSMADATKMFGENALEMIRILGQGKDAVSQMFEGNKGFDEAAKAAEKFNDNWEKLSNSIMPTVYEFAGKIAGKLNEAVTGARVLLDSEGTTKETISESVGGGLSGATSSEKKRLTALELKAQMLEEQLSNTSKTNGIFFKDKNPEYEKLLQQAQQARDAVVAYTKEVGKNMAERRKAEEERTAEEQRIKSETEKNQRLSRIGKVEEDYAKSKLSDSDKLLNAKLELENIEAELKAKKESNQIDEEYESKAIKRISLLKEVESSTKRINDADKLKQEQIQRQKQQQEKERQIAEDKLKKEKEAANQKALSQAETIKSRMEEMSLQVQIDNAKRKGNQAEIEHWEKIKRIRELVKQGFTEEQASKFANAEAKLNNSANKSDNPNYSDDEIAKAKSILSRGEGGSIGKKTLEEAQAIVEGRRPEKGFNTAMFKDSGDKTKRSQNELDRNRQAFHPEEKQRNDKASNNEESEDTKALKDMLDVLKSIKDASEKTAENIKKTNDSSK